MCVCVCVCVSIHQICSIVPLTLGISAASQVCSVKSSEALALTVCEGEKRF